MHFRLQQGRSRHFSERALPPSRYTFGDVSVISLGDFDQLEPIDDISMVDTETNWQSLRKNLQHLWKHIRQGKYLLEEFQEVFMLDRIHRSKDDLWWTESCLRLRDFICTKDGDYDWWKQHDLDRGDLTKEQKNISKMRPCGSAPGAKTSAPGTGVSCEGWWSRITR